MSTLSRNDLNVLIPIIESGWNNAHILIVGDVMLDKYAFGQVERISPEAPVPVVRTTRTSAQPGGAANVAMNVAKLGAKATLVGFTGQDQDQVTLKQLLADANIDCALIEVPTIPTISKLRVLGGQQQIVRLDSESLSMPPSEAYGCLLHAVTDILPSVDVVVLSDYAKGVLSPHVCQQIIADAKRLNIPVLVDPKVRDFSRYAGATTICPNLSELALATGHGAGDIALLLEHGQRFVQKYGIEYLTVTMSERGIAVLWPEQQEHFPAVVRQVFDVSGAGDTVIALLALCATCRLPVNLAARLANLAAGIIVGKIGTVPVTKIDLLAALSVAYTPQMHEKIFTLSQLMAKAQEWRAAGEKVVFTNGCFDLLHIGHVTLLEHSKQLGTKLVIGINSDASVSALKGPSRPIVGQLERARLLAALSAADAVVVFDQPTPLEIIRMLKPDVLVKGGDYVDSMIVGTDDVKSWHGQVVLVPLVEGFSTTKIIEKLMTKAI